MAISSLSWKEEVLASKLQIVWMFETSRPLGFSVVSIWNLTHREPLGGNARLDQNNHQWNMVSLPLRASKMGLTDTPNSSRQKVSWRPHLSMISAVTIFILILCISSPPILSVSFLLSWRSRDLKTGPRGREVDIGLMVGCLWHWQWGSTKMWRTISLLNAHWHSKNTLYSKATKIALHYVTGVTFY